jgi:hypothetical protein
MAGSFRWGNMRSPQARKLSLTSAEDADGYVVVDAVQVLPVEADSQ